MPHPEDAAFLIQAAWPVMPLKGGKPVLVRCAFEGQGHVGQVAFGLNQHQRGVFSRDRSRALARHRHWFDFSGDGCLSFGNFCRIRVDPLQSRTLGYLGQVLQRQCVRLDFRQAGDCRRGACWCGCRHCHDRRRCWCSSQNRRCDWDGCRDRDRCYDFRSCWR